MYFSKFLKIPDVKSRFLRNRLQLLKDIVRGSLLNIPLQNVTSIGVLRPGPKPGPSFKGILDSVFRGHGGMCIHNNMALKILLESIGYDSHVCPAKFVRNSLEFSHAVCLVKIPPPHSLDGKSEDTYIVDVGSGVPLNEPILVSSSVPYTGRAGGLDFMYGLSPNGTTFNRVNKAGDAFVGQKSLNYVSGLDCTIWLEPITTADLLAHGSNNYGTPGAAAHVHNSFYLFRYLDIAPDFSDFKILCILGKDVRTITRETQSTESFKTYDEIERLINEYFPEVPRHEVGQAKYNFSQIESEIFQ